MKTVLMILAAVFLFAFVIVGHEFGHFSVAKLLGVNVLEFSLGMGPAIAQFRKGDDGTIYSVRAIPLGGYCRLQGEDPDDEDEEDEEPEDDERPSLFGRASELQPPEHLDPAGAFTAQPFFNRIAILFAGPFMNLLCCLLLLVIVYSMQGHGIGVALRASFAATGYILVVMKESLKQLFTGLVGVESISGIVGIVDTVRQQAELGLANLIYTMAVISVNLGIVNLLPFPALDGGRILLIIINKITGNKITPKMEGMINAVGMMILLVLMVLLIFKDAIGLMR